MTRPRVLLVDDDAAVREAVSSALAGEGYEVTWFADAENALRRALVQPPAVVLLDVTMPRLDGWELCEILKRQS
ncbi:MAG TPA: response regulator, partial [Vicinamibacteria bacterium]|nr:response regulator [Vicinamibacteria bacterium]